MRLRVDHLDALVEVSDPHRRKFRVNDRLLRVSSPFTADICSNHIEKTIFDAFSRWLGRRASGGNGTGLLIEPKGRRNALTFRRKDDFVFRLRILTSANRTTQEMHPAGGVHFAHHVSLVGYLTH